MVVAVLRRARRRRAHLPRRGDPRRPRPRHRRLPPAVLRPRPVRRRGRGGRGRDSSRPASWTRPDAYGDTDPPDSPRRRTSGHASTSAGSAPTARWPPGPSTVSYPNRPGHADPGARSGGRRGGVLAAVHAGHHRHPRRGPALARRRRAQLTTAQRRRPRLLRRRRPLPRRHQAERQAGGRACRRPGPGADWDLGAVHYRVAWPRATEANWRHGLLAPPARRRAGPTASRRRRPARLLDWWAARLPRWNRAVRVASVTRQIRSPLISTDPP